MYIFNFIVLLLPFFVPFPAIHTCFVSGLAYLCPVHTKNPSSSYVGSRKCGWGQNLMNRNDIE